MQNNRRKVWKSAVAATAGASPTPAQTVEMDVIAYI